MVNENLLIIDATLENINKILDETKNYSIEDFLKSESLLKDTYFSFTKIGEQMSKMHDIIADKYYMLPWEKLINLKNVIGGDSKIDINQIYYAVKNLNELKVSFLAIKNDIENNYLETNRLVLRKIKKSDAKYIFNNYANDEEVTKFLTWNVHKNIKKTEKIVDIWSEAEKNPKTIRYVIVLKGTDEPVGMIDIVNFDGDIPEIGYCLSRKLWSKGYMTEACKALLKYLFGIGFKEVTIGAVEENIGSNKVIEKCGFKFIRKESRQLSKIKPQIVVINRYKLLKKDFKN